MAAGLVKMAWPQVPGHALCARLGLDRRSPGMDARRMARKPTWGDPHPQAPSGDDMVMVTGEIMTQRIE